MAQARGDKGMDPGDEAQVEAESAAEPLPVILTKIRLPRRRPDVLTRPRLLDFFHSHLDRKLLLLSAPAGFGKTTLLTDFAHDTDLPVCWYTLDTFDRDLHLFLEHLIAAIAHRFPQFGERSRALLSETVDPGANLYPVVATLVQELYDTVPEYFYLVLDDHHTVEDQDRINEFLDLFVTYVDESCHVILASRMLPALPNLSLLVARRQAAGMSIDELRFTPDEVQQLAQQSYDIHLSLDQATRLVERTGGWITGVLLTSVRQWQPAGSESTSWGGIDANLYDYLSRQVLDLQPRELRSFLLHSSVLDELSADLCAEVLGLDHAAELMAELMARNLFVVEYEGGEGQLRYHDLFHEFLRDTLRRENKDAYRHWMLRAARAYEARGRWEQAVSRYLELGQIPAVIDVLRRTAIELYDTGRWDTLAGWIDALPAETQAAHPALQVHRAKIWMERGDLAAALSLFRQAEETWRARGDSAMMAYAVAMQGYVRRFRGEYAQAIACAEQALAMTAGAAVEEYPARALAHKNMGLCWMALGELERGRQALEESLRMYESLNDTVNVGMLLHDLGLSCEMEGDLRRAAGYYQGALARWEQLGNPGPWANTLNGLGVIYYWQGEYDSALSLLDQALQKSQQAGDLRVEAYVWASLGDVHRALLAYERARQAYIKSLDLAGQAKVGAIRAYALCALGNTLRLMGETGRARDHLHVALEVATRQGSALDLGMCHTALGALACQERSWSTARRHLDEAITLLARSGVKRERAVAHLHRAHLCLATGERGAALGELAEALALTATLSHDQFLVVEGQSLLGLIRYAEKQGLAPQTLPHLRARIEDLLQQATQRPEPLPQVVGGSTLRIWALDRARVEVDGQPVQWPTVQSRDLFFCLLQHQNLRKEEIGNLFWPDHPPRRLDGIFRSTLYRLRRAAGRNTVLYEDGVYRFNRDIDYWYDVEAFETRLHRAERSVDGDQQAALLESALELCKEDYLEGVYADWCAMERERLREHRMAALELLAGLHASRGHLRRAIEAYQSLVHLDPYRELAHRELMRCYFRLGDRAMAIRQYRLCADILREDLGVSPMQETEDLYLQIID